MPCALGWLAAIIQGWRVLTLELCGPQWKATRRRSTPMTQPPNQADPYQPIELNDVRKLLDSKLVNTGVPGAIFGFGISRAFEEEWWQFVLLLVAAAGVWLLIKVGSRVAPRVESAIDTADRAVAQQFDRAQTTFTGFGPKYLEALKTHCFNLNVEGYKGRLPRLVLDQVYVPLRVNPGQHSGNTLDNRRREIWDLLPKATSPDRTFPERLIAIIADPGYGKTTLLRFLTLSFANQSHRDHNAKPLIPILLLFREVYGRIQSKTQPTLTQLIVEAVQTLPRCSELRTSEQWFKDQLMQGRCLVMLDGLDEVPEAQREVVSQWANWQMQHYPSPFILTSRPHGYDGSLFDGVQRFDILDFNDDQKRTFIDQWYRFITWELTWKSHWQESQHSSDPHKRLAREQAEAESNAAAQEAADDLKRQLFAERSLTDLAKNPLLITIIAATHEASEQLPTRRTHLYQEIFKLLLEYRPNRRDTRLTIANAEDNQLILQRLAIKLTELGKTQFSTQQGAEWIKERLASLYPDPTLTPHKFLREIQQVSGLLAGGESDLYEFAHKTFQEYLTAKELMANPTGHTRILEKLTDENWKEVVYFAALLSGDPTPFIEAALKDPTNLYTLELAERLAKDDPRVSETLKVELLDALDLQAPEQANVRLAQRFQNLTPLSPEAALSEAITWGEYKLFLQDQVDGIFYSQVATERYEVEYLPPSDLVDDITWAEAQWFCAWLSTQPSLALGEGTYDYRLPTVDELATAGLSDPTAQPWTTDPTRPGHTLRIVRQRIPDHYQTLVNYLASGSWRDADQETDKLMLKAVGPEAEKRGYLELKEIRNFPCPDLQLLDRLWVKFSGGKFGFSVQKQIYVECGNPLNGGFYENAWNVFADRVGWRKDGSYLNYDDLKADPSFSPDGEFPEQCMLLYPVRGIFGHVLFSRTETCEL